MRPFKINKSVLASAGLTVVLCVAGCTGSVSGQGQVSGPPIPTFASSTRSSPAPSVQPSVTSVSPAPAPQPTPAPSPRPEPVRSGDCKAGELKLTAGQGEGAAGTIFRPVRFTNSGNRTCELRGFPGVSYVAGDDGHQVGPAAAWEGAKGAAVRLAPGETAFATVAFVQVRNFDEAVCRPTPVRGLRVYPPQEFAAMFLPLEGTGCAGTPPSPQLRVRTVQKGLGGA